MQVETQFGVVTIEGGTVRIDATDADTYRWAHRPGAHWPCSTLEDVESFYVEFDECGLIDADLPGEDDDVWIDGNELSAFCADVLRPVLSDDHPAYLVAVGQFTE